MPAAGPLSRGRPGGRLKPAKHPFAAAADLIARALAGASAVVAPAVMGWARGETSGDEATVWLPGDRSTPKASPHLIRAETSTGWPPGPGPSVGLWPFTVPVLRMGPGPALDTLLALSDLRSPGVSPGESVHAMGAVAGLALEIVAGGRVLPGLALDGTSDGRPRYLARWAPIGGGRDDERLRLVAGSLPPVCRALDSGPGHGEVFSGSDPEDLVRSALSAFVDATCREAVRRAGRRLTLFTRAASRPRPAPIEAWLAALAAPGPEVDADPGELAKLERLADEWRVGVVGRGGPWRLSGRSRRRTRGAGRRSQRPTGGLPTRDLAGRTAASGDGRAEPGRRGRRGMAVGSCPAAGGPGTGGTPRGPAG
jgi:hypothetical protein